MHIEDLHVADDESAELENVVVESDNKGIPEGYDRIYFDESDIYFAAPEKTSLERKVKLKNMSASSTTSMLACTARK